MIKQENNTEDSGEILKKAAGTTETLLPRKLKRVCELKFDKLIQQLVRYFENDMPNINEKKNDRKLQLEMKYFFFANVKKFDVQGHLTCQYCVDLFKTVATLNTVGYNLQYYAPKSMDYRANNGASEI